MLRQLACALAVLAMASCQAERSSQPRADGKANAVLLLDVVEADNLAPFARTTDAHGVTRVYHHTFETEPGKEWSSNKISRAVMDNRPYLGGFEPQKPVTLTVGNLPEHSLVRISFDLLVIGGWSGSSEDFGYSRFDMDTGDGRSLLHTSFCNWGAAYNNNNAQAFPDTYPARPFPGWTLAAEKQSLGSMINTQQGVLYDASSVYRLVLTFPHKGKDITFGFHSMEQGWKEKFFGLANVTVETLPAPAPLTEAQLETMWKELGENDPQKFFAAEWGLIAAGDQAVDYISKHVQDSIDPPGEEVVKMIEELAAADEDHGPAIFDKVVRLGHIAIAPLREASKDTRYDDEVRKRLEEARVESKRFNESPTELRNFRLRHLLQAIHTPAASTLRLSIPEPPPRNLDLR